MSRVLRHPQSRTRTCLQSRIQSHRQTSQNTSKIVSGSQPNEIQKSSWEARNQPQLVPNRPKIVAGSLPEASGGPRAGPVVTCLIFCCFCDPKMNPKVLLGEPGPEKARNEHIFCLKSVSPERLPETWKMEPKSDPQINPKVVKHGFLARTLHYIP